MYNKVTKRLDILKCNYELLPHQIVQTAEETKEVLDSYGYQTIKNLFLTNKKGDMFYLVSMPWNKPVKIAEIGTNQGVGRVSFGNDDILMEIMGVKSGSVGAFNLLNVKTNDFKYFIDEDIMEYEYLTFHPNQNDYTIAIKRDDFLKYLKTTKKEFEVVKI
ncbi:MAG: YbaK/EbsC family protein [Bacilli bacterium]